MYQLGKGDKEYRIFCFACADPFAFITIYYVQLQFADHLKRLLHTLLNDTKSKNWTDPGAYAAFSAGGAL